MLKSITRLNKCYIGLVSLGALCGLMLTMPIEAQASPRLMADGNYFDAAFYADYNPDIVSILGLKVYYGEPLEDSPIYKAQLEAQKNIVPEEISPEQVKEDVEATISVKYDNASATKKVENLLRETTMNTKTEEVLYSHYLEFGRDEKRLAYFIDKSVPSFAGTSLSPQDSKPYRYVIVMGDSRTCGMSHLFATQKDWKLVKAYTLSDPTKAFVGRKCSVYEKNGIRVAFCEFGGGNLVNGAFNQVCKWAKQVIATAEPGSNFIVINNMGVNDIFYEPNEGAAMSYRQRNEEFACSLPEGSRYITCTVGPVDEKGTVAQSGLCNNDIIAIQNTMIVPTEHVEVFDENTALIAAGYDCVITEEDPAGIHYMEATTAKLVRMMMGYCGIDPTLFDLKY